MADCWVKDCDGNHYDSGIHPKHICRWPIERWHAERRRAAGQSIRGKVVDQQPKVWRCKECGKHWRKTAWNGWVLSVK